MRKTKTSYVKGRMRNFLWLLIQKYQPNCVLCSKPLTEADIPTVGTDQLTEHHSDGNHSNNQLSNRSIVHRTCHKSYHSKDNILKSSRSKVVSKNVYSSDRSVSSTSPQPLGAGARLKQRQMLLK